MRISTISVATVFRGRGLQIVVRDLRGLPRPLYDSEVWAEFRCMEIAREQLLRGRYDATELLDLVAASWLFEYEDGSQRQWSYGSSVVLEAHGVDY